MRFCSNLALEQTEVRLLKEKRKKKAAVAQQVDGGNVGEAKEGGRSLTGPKNSGKSGANSNSNPFRVLGFLEETEGDGGMGDVSRSGGGAGGDGEMEEVLVADSNYLPYECMQGICCCVCACVCVRVRVCCYE
jgi:hypothetical protein